MLDETLESRLDAIRQQLEQATDAFEQCRHDSDIGQRIENANAREIEKLKRHVAKLQADGRERGTQ